MDTQVIIMFEPPIRGEVLSAQEQVNEVFGPFYSGETAEHAVMDARIKFPNREWLVIPLSSPEILKIKRD